MSHPTSSQAGYLVVLVLVFGAIFFIMVVAFMGFVIQQKIVQDAERNEERALAVAEAGLNYYKWYLAHNPGDITNGTGAPGPYTIAYNDPEGGAIGEYDLEISSTEACGSVQSIDIVSTGRTFEDPDRERTIYARYAQPTVSEYAYIINSNVWAGADRTIIGPYHSNGGIRMDGTNNSTVTSGLEDWTCTGTFGCNPDSTEDGVFGAGPNSDLWTFPSTPINFTGLTLDLAAMQTSATANGRYFGPSGNQGYLVQFLSNNTFNLSRVTGTRSYWAYNSAENWHTEQGIITASTFIGNFSIPTDCSLIFIEDDVWIEGTLSNRVTLAAADNDSVGVDPTIIINDNITYSGSDAGLLALAEFNVLVGLDVPSDMDISGIFIAQDGRFGRNFYCDPGVDPNGCNRSIGDASLPADLQSLALRNSLTMHGTIVSNGRVGTRWTNSGTWVSGFNTRFNSYDRDLVENPPPLTPQVSDTYQFIDWREEE